MFFALVLYIFLKRRRDASRLPLPPGPKKLPIIGNLLDIPKSFEWITYHKWCQELRSDIIHLDVAGTSIIVLDNVHLATELLEKRSSIYSGRARMPMINELMGWSFNVAFMAYGDHWRQHRELLHREFHPNAAMRFRPHELKATHGLLRRLLETPDDLIKHLQQMAGETIIGIAYGLQVQEKDDPYVATATKGVHPVSVAAVPGAFLVDTLPILKYVPDWMPFAGFKRKAKVWRKYALDMINLPYEAAKRNIENGDGTPSFTLSSLEKIDQSGDVNVQEYIIKSTAGTMYAGKLSPHVVDKICMLDILPIAGSETTVSAISAGILGLLSNPAAFQKARDEIDRVVGTQRLPTFNDFDSLPYLTAITKEALRWKAAAPIGMASHLFKSI
ncbi:hypothetical protein H0H92_000727 [Tricholoma furcatifolium]|nr:hypothetical protein H0H92_000727 [Tricholoma furcatifolium]